MSVSDIDGKSAFGSFGHAAARPRFPFLTQRGLPALTRYRRCPAPVMPSAAHGEKC